MAYLKVVCQNLAAKRDEGHKKCMASSQSKCNLSFE